MFKRDDEAAGQVVAFMVGGAIFLATIAAALIATQDSHADPSPAQDSSKIVEVTGLADLLVASSGVGWDGGADGVDRLGLASSNGSGLDPASLDALRGAMEASTDNDRVDYEDALVGLGMDPAGTEGFHIRIYPLGMDELEMDPTLSIGYIADFDELLDLDLMYTAPVLSQEAMAVRINADMNTTMMANTIYERQAIRALGADFTDRLYITAGAPSILINFPWPISDKQLLTVLNIPLLEGDVYPDDEDYLDVVFEDRMELYDVLVVGAGVDHGNLLGFKEEIAEWVDDGGTLIVLGSADKSTAWLNPLLNTGISTVNGSPIAPDITHPLLKEPNDLAWSSYDSYDLGWDLQENGDKAVYDDFSHVVLQQGEDVLTVSKDGSFGLGRVILTTFHPRDIAASMTLAEATNFLENMVSYADRSALYLDYGGTIPTDVPVAMAVRQSYLWDEAYGQVPVRVEVLAWA